MRLIWFVLAGFLLGFSVSTLWEWLYFRRRRIASLEITEQHSESGGATRAHAPASTARHGAPQVAPGDEPRAAGREEIDEPDADSEEWDAAYAGPGVFLESEDEDADTDAAADADADVEIDVDIDADSDEEPASPYARSAAADVSSQTDVDASEAGGTRADEPPTVTSGRPGGFVAPPASARPGVARSSRPAMPERYRPDARPGARDAGDRPASNMRGDQAAADTRGGESSAVFTKAPAPASAPPRVVEVSGPSISPRSGKSTRPARKTDNYPDDLAKIKGIGEVYKQRLYAADIYTWHQIAETDEETLRAATQAYPSSNVDEWAEQARQLTERNSRQGAVYTGPPPQELTRIYGIGPVGATTLYRAGICTYAQLAAATPEMLAPLFPIAVAGDEPDFEHWIAQAREYSRDES